jgi:peptidoglycan/LPS O-acetylase OafA/YrhL
MIAVHPAPSMVDLGRIATTGAAARPGLLAVLAAIPARLRRRMSGGTYRPEIDGLRFFAIAIVIVGHICERAVRFFPSAQALLERHPGLAIFEQGGMGVLLFFTISGFIIATQARKAKASPLSGAFLRAYYGRRILRIEPPYMILLIATWIVIGATGYRPEGTHQFDTAPASLTTSLVGSLFYIHGLVWGTFPRLFPPGWSLEVEVQFYLTAPLLFWVWFRFDNPRVRIAFGLVVLCLANMLSVFAPQTIGPLWVDKSILRFFHFFWLGILLADANGWIVSRARNVPAVAATAIGWAGLAGFLFLPQGALEPARELIVHCAGYLAIAAMFVSALAQTSGFRRFCAAPWISLIGGACYSLYLVHLQVTQVMAAALYRLRPDVPLAWLLPAMAIAALGVVVAGLTYYVLVERFFMIPNWHRLVAARIAALVRRDANSPSWKAPAE